MSKIITFGTKVEEKNFPICTVFLILANITAFCLYYSLYGKDAYVSQEQIMWQFSDMEKYIALSHLYSLIRESFILYLI